MDNPFVMICIVFSKTDIISNQFIITFCFDNEVNKGASKYSGKLYSFEHFIFLSVQ